MRALVDTNMCPSPARPAFGSFVRDQVRGTAIDRLARERLGLDPAGRYVLSPYDPARATKRLDRAEALAGDDAQLLTLGAVPPEDIPTWVNAVNAVVCPSDWETFGLACIEALACDVPVLARPTGAHPEALRGIAGALCGEWNLDAWRAALAPHLAAADPRIEGRARAREFSAGAFADRVAGARRWLAEGGPAPPLYSRAEAPASSPRGALLT
jgi:teichuronic acid biosynthesis glycosyltransferase TuaC